MPFIQIGEEFGEVKEAPLAPEAEYDLLCHEVEHDTEKGKNNLVVTIRFEGEDYQPFRHWIALPNPQRDVQNDQEKGHKPGTTAKTKMLMAKRFLHLFNVPYTDKGFDPNDIKGARARAPVTQGSFTSQDGSEVPVNRLNLPRLPDEVNRAA